MGLLSISLKNRGSASFIIYHFYSWAEFFTFIFLITSIPSENFYRFFYKYYQTWNSVSVVTIRNHNDVPFRFRVFGVDDVYLLNNADNMLIFWCSCLLIFIFGSIATCKMCENFRRTVCDNVIVRGSLVAFFQIVLYSLLQITRFEITTWYGITNSVLAVTFLACAGLMIIYVPIASFLKIRDAVPEEMAKIGTVIDEFDTERVMCRFYYVLFMFERIVAAVSYTMIKEYPNMQSLFIALALFVKGKIYAVLYVIVFKPFQRSFDNVFICILESITIVSISLVASFSADSMNDNMKGYITWGIFGLLWFGISFSFFYYLFRVMSGEVLNCKVMNVQVMSDPNDDSTQNNIVTDKKNYLNNETIEAKSDNEDKKSSKIVLVTSKIKDSENKSPKIMGTDDKKGLDNGDQKGRMEVFEMPDEFDKNYGSGIPYYEALAKKYLSRGNNI